MSRNKAKRLNEALAHFGAGSNVDAYMGGLSPDGEERGRVAQVSLHDLAPAPWQPRVYESPERMEELAESIRRHGMLHPITVRPYRPEPGAIALFRYEVVAGHRRLEAVKRLAKERNDGQPTTVPVLVKDLDELQARLLTHVENLDRDDLCAWETSHSIENVRAALATASEPHDVRSVAERVARAAGTTSEYLQIAAAVTELLLREGGACTPDGCLDVALVHRMTKDELLRVARADEATRVAAMRSLVERLRGASAPRRRAKRSTSYLPAELVAEPFIGRRPRFTVEQLRDRGRFTMNLTKPFSEYGLCEAQDYLNDLLPAIAALGDIVAGEWPLFLKRVGPGFVLYLRGDSHMAAQTGVREAMLRLIQEVRAACGASAGQRSDHEADRRAQEAGHGSLG